MSPALQLATFVVAILGLVVATASLTWNVVQFLLGGSRPTVQLVIGALAPGGLITMEPGLRAANELDRLAASDGYADRVIGVRVINRGRAPTTVQRWGIKTDDPSGGQLEPAARVDRSAASTMSSTPARRRPGSPTWLMPPGWPAPRPVPSLDLYRRSTALSSSGPVERFARSDPCE